MNTELGKIGYYAIKVDFEKAYYRLNWGFIQETLILAGLPLSFMNIVMECITLVSFSIL